MFEGAEVRHKLDKASYEAQVPALREALLDAQWALKATARFSVIVLIAGVDGAGKGETVNTLNEWMDPRNIHTVAFDGATEEEAHRPQMWRYWRELPRKGQIGIFFGSWYTDPIVGRVWKKSSKPELEMAIERINRFERMLADEGALILKFWFHLDKKSQRERLEKIDADPVMSWQVTRADWQQFKRYDRYAAVSEHTLRETSTGHAPWVVVEGRDARYRHVTVATVLLESIRKHLALGSPAAGNVVPVVPPVDARNVLNQMDLSRRLPARKYRGELVRWQGELNKLARSTRFAERSVICAFEGMDAAGKGGAIRRVTAALDARQYQIIPIAAPTDEERAQPYLWRFWRHLPRLGRFTLYDRSWYGRVLVERIEGFCSEADWRRAYAEINQFEQELHEGGGVLCKFWLQISQDEQLRRFKARESVGFKHFKITDEDWRNREQWPRYETAAAEMIERTSTTQAPWTLVEAEDKNGARIKILQTLVERIETALD
jgi:polyphosphate:AMP phosphotransferase